ncbi:cupin [Tatumella ptyseos]|uniref:cupin n=1 Tax=Tatumella ptyseos TaxID=82987 RepID=UPI0026E91F91|nr:cupin [Tatumella ptyseos]WKX26906.1 cupin [Tatumella ptyseos]
MKIVSSRQFIGAHAWQALDIADFDGTSVRLHWTDKPYKWHINDGQEVFAVLQGCVEMFYRVAAEEKSVILQVGDIFYASVGTEHVAHPLGEARILVIEKAGSV